MRALMAILIMAVLAVGCGDSADVQTADVNLCGDGKKNGGESDIDCGGGIVCERCEIGMQCGNYNDCNSNVCRSGECVPAICENGLHDLDTQWGSEGDVDCGRFCKKLCTHGQSCGIYDCEEGTHCAMYLNRCAYN